MLVSSFSFAFLIVIVTFSSVYLLDLEDSSIQHHVKLTVTQEPTKVKEEIEDKNSIGDKVTLDTKPHCDEKNPDCIKDRVGLDAIIYLHGLIDDDHNGNVDQSESDEFFRDELKYTDGFERLSIFHGNDKLISVGDLWQAWKKSQVYNWTVDDVAEWMVKHVELKQYVNNFKTNSVDGPTLPRLAVPDHNYMSNVLGVKNGVHRQKISVKAMDLVLFGPPKELHNYLKDLALILSLVIALGGCWFAYMQHKYSKTHMKKMLTEMENLQKAEESLLQLQDKLKNAQQEQESVCEEKKSLEQKYHDEIATAKREAERLKKAREGSMEEISRLKLAEEELAQVRVALRRAEKELERNQWSAPTELKLWLQLTHEIEVQYFNNKKREAEKYFVAARDECERVRRKRGTFLGPLRVAHGNSIDTVDQRIDEARTKLEEVRGFLQERLQRWNRIEHICGFPVVSNPGLDNLQQILHRDVDIAGSNKYSPSLLANIDVEDAELDEDPPPGYPQAAMLYHTTLANGLPRPPPYPAGYPPGLHRRPQQLSPTSSIPRPQPKKNTSLGSLRSSRTTETSPTTSSPTGSERPVFTLDASSPESPVIPSEKSIGGDQVGVLNMKIGSMPRSQTTSLISASVHNKRDSQGNTSLPPSVVSAPLPLEKRSQSDADLLLSIKSGILNVGNFESLDESDSGSNSLGMNGHQKRKKLKMPKFFSRKEKPKTS